MYDRNRLACSKVVFKEVQLETCIDAHWGQPSLKQSYDLSAVAPLYCQAVVKLACATLQPTGMPMRIAYDRLRSILRDVSL
jgi:hypothetical protein